MAGVNAYDVIAPTVRLDKEGIDVRDLRSRGVADPHAPRATPSRTA
jgi:hypothetical protein